MIIGQTKGMENKLLVHCLWAAFSTFRWANLVMRSRRDRDREWGRKRQRDQSSSFFDPENNFKNIGL